MVATDIFLGGLEVNGRSTVQEGGIKKKKKGVFSLLPILYGLLANRNTQYILLSIIMNFAS